MITSMLSEGLQKTIIDIPLVRIRPNPYQPRRFFDTAALAELASSIKEYGVIQPITVRKMPDGMFEIVSGERRFRASAMAGMQTVPAIIAKFKDDDSAVIALLENLQRRDLTFFEEAEGYALMIEKHGFTQEELAQRIGKSQSTIANKMRLLKLEKELREQIFENGLTERHARELLRLPDTKSRQKILDTIIRNNLNVAKTEALIRRELDKTVAEKRFSDLRTTPSGFKNYKLFCNTINQALCMIRKSGIKTYAEQKENSDCYEFLIRIAK